MTWLHMPPRILNAFIEALPRLRAEESMHGAQVAQYGNASQQTARRLWQQWETAAKPPSRLAPGQGARDYFLQMMAKSGVERKI